MASDPVKLGTLCGADAQRDAIHVAVAPVTAAHPLSPGQHVGLDENGMACAEATAIGVVDPFLRRPVLEGDDFWLCLYPQTVTSLRHEWTHPAFEALSGSDKAQSEMWLRGFAEDIGVAYSTLMNAAECWIENGDYEHLSRDIPDRVYTDKREFWKHYEIVTGTKVEDHDETFFSCSC